MGIDLSPDGNTLAVADKSSCRIHLIDLLTEQITTVDFSPARMEGGTFSVAYGNDGRLLVSTRFNGSGWVPLRRYDPSSGAIDVIRSVRQDTMLSASADGSVIAFAESNTTGGPFGRYRVADGNILAAQTYTFNDVIGVNRNGTQYAVPTYEGCYIYNQNLYRYARIGGYALPEPMGVAYHPLQDIVYFTWAHTTKVLRYDTITLTQTAEYEFENPFEHLGEHVYQEGRLKVSRDGKYLFSTVDAGVRFIRPDNTAPSAMNINVRTDEDVPKAATLRGSDPDGDPLTYIIVTQPSNGILSGDAPNLTYTPNADYHGVDQFTYKVNDGDLDSAVYKVNILVNPINDPPVAADASVTTAEDTSVNITLTATDPDYYDVLSYSMQSGPSHGTLSGAAPNLVYTPSPDYNGPDSFAFIANDGAVDSAPATVSISVIPVNDAPGFTLAGTEIEAKRHIKSWTVPGWATGIYAGPENESDQTVGFLLTNDHPELFSVQPAIDTAGNLTFCIAEKVKSSSELKGTAVVSVFAQDDGGTLNGGADCSPVQTFAIRIK